MATQPCAVAGNLCRGGHEQCGEPAAYRAHPKGAAVSLPEAAGVTANAQAQPKQGVDWCVCVYVCVRECIGVYVRVSV